MKILAYRLIPLFAFILMMSGITTTAHAEEVVTQAVDLAPGWNIVSTPMVLTSHTFSAAETSENFDIYLLDASKPTGWSTMADIGQSEFTPLYGYYINNKTDEYQTLTFNYDTSVEPNQKLFERTFTAEGWYSIGIANAEYAKTQKADREDTDNPSDILSLLTGKYDLVIDFTDDFYDFDRKSVALSDPWKAVVPSDIDELNDFRDTKGYAVYIKESGARYSGFQNDAAVEEVHPGELLFSLSPNNPEASYLAVNESDTTGGFTVLEYTIEAQYGPVELNELWVNLETGTGLQAIVNVDDVAIIIDGGLFYVNTRRSYSVSAADFMFDIDGNILIFEGESVTVEVVVEFNPQDGNYAPYGETIQARVTEELVGETLAYNIDGQISTEYLTGDAIGETHTLRTEGAILELDSTSETHVDNSDTTTDDDVGVFTISFDVTAFETDVYVNKTAASGTAMVTAGVNFTLEGTNGDPVAAGTSTASLESTADTDTGRFIVSEGETQTFTLTVEYDPADAGFYQLQLYSLNFNTTNADPSTQQLTLPEEDYETGFLSI